jgi:hypothetical protein
MRRHLQNVVALTGATLAFAASLFASAGEAGRSREAKFRAASS